MLFEELFLEKTDLQKFLMFRVLKTIDANSFTINDISTALNLSYQQTYNAFQDLLTDMRVLDKNIDKNVGRHKLMSQDSFHVTLDRYRLFLLKHSLVFQFVDYLVQHANPTIDNFCETQFVSKSTLLRKTAALKKFMNRYSLRFSYTHLRIIGDERNIRLLLFTFYWIGFHGIEWPINEFSFKDMFRNYQRIDMKSNDIIVELQEVLMLGICRTRVEHGYLIHNGSDFDLLTHNNATFEKLSFAEDVIPGLSKNQSLNEHKFFFFSRYITISFSPEFSDQSQEFYKHFATENNTVWKFTQNFMTYLVQYSVPEKQSKIINDRQLTTNVLRLAMAAEVLQEDHPKLMDFYSHEHPEYEQSNLFQIIRNYFQTIKTNPDFKIIYSCHKSLAHYLYYLLIPYLRQFEKKQIVKVRLLMENNDLLTRDVSVFLRDISIVQVLDNKASFEDADLIVTTVDDVSHYLGVKFPDDKKIVHWNLDAQDSDFYSLYMKIKHTYLTKLT
ncbi:hypothetical protein ACX53_12025 [Loigolactobacillus backii]|nr:hypothetical protein ACX53_12025 [Loigolactobacillus backii]